MSAPPKTVLNVEPGEAEAIRQAVQAADVRTLDAARAFAEAGDTEGLTEFLRDPRVSDPIHDLPRPIEPDAIARWIETCAAARRRGEGLLMLTRDEDGAIAGFSRISVWPERSAAELSGAIRADRQNAGQGGAAAWRTVHWMFETLGVRLICLTAAADNIRSARLIEAMGFVRMGERIGVAEDGGERSSLYWEMTREDWRGPTA